MLKKHILFYLLLQQLICIQTNTAWSNETFEIYNQAKNPEGIAIDIRTKLDPATTMLSQKFDTVITVNTNATDLQHVKNNLDTCQFSNIIICNELLTNIRQHISSGPKQITFKQCIHDYVYQNDNIKGEKISLISCNIEGLEEDLLEDILYFAFYNKVKVYLSFHTDTWKDKNISRYKYMFDFFNTNCAEQDICSHIQNNPTSSILFEPKETNNTLIKKNMPVVIIGYNLVTYIKNTVSQLEKYTNDIIIIDNNSNFEPLLDYYDHEFKYTLLKQNGNYGFIVIYRDYIQNLLGDVHIVTDPDLRYNKDLPDDFIKTFIEISQHFKAYKVGFALDISSEKLNLDIKNDVFQKNIKEWESQYWEKKLYWHPNKSLELYAAPIDTTFCLVNKKHIKGTLNVFFPATQFCIRVAGNYTCEHLPWYKNFKEDFLIGEFEAYMRRDFCTSWSK